jgi:hypothetical protein
MPAVMPRFFLITTKSRDHAVGFICPRGSSAHETALTARLLCVVGAERLSSKALR